MNGVFRNNGISYLSIPSKDHRRSAEFYHAVFGWKVEVGPASASFEDGTGHVIGHFEAQFKAVGEAGVVPFIYVDDLKAVVERVAASGGQILKQPYREGNLTVALFGDPEGNVMGIWQQSATDRERGNGP